MWQDQTRYIRKNVFPYRLKPPYFHYRIHEVGEILHVSDDSVMRFMLAGWMYPVQIKQELFIRESELRRYAEAELKRAKGVIGDVRDEIRLILEVPPPILDLHPYTLKEARTRLGLSREIFDAIIPRGYAELIDESGRLAISESTLLRWADETLELGKQYVKSIQRKHWDLYLKISGSSPTAGDQDRPTTFN